MHENHLVTHKRKEEKKITLVYRKEIKRAEEKMMICYSEAKTAVRF